MRRPILCGRKISEQSGDEYVLTNDTSLHLRRPTTSESADIKQSFTMQNNNENKSAGISSNGNLNKNRLNGVKNMSIRNRRLIVLLFILILIIIGSFTSIYRIFSSLIHQNSLNPNSGYSQNRSLLYYMKTQVVSNVQRIKEMSHKRYQSRISAVKNFCANKRYKISKVERNNAANLTTRWRQEMWWDIRNGFAWCCVYKVASSSLVTHMINIAGWEWDAYLQHLEDIKIERRRWRDYMIEELYPLPSDVTLQEANKNLLLMAYVRNPFSRIASGYLEKFVHEWDMKKERMEYKWLRDRILVNYRLSGDFEVPLPYPTPLEFAQFIIDESKRIGIEYLDIHFRPQWFSCPFCAMDFDMIGSAEEFEEDFEFFISEFKLQEKVNKDLRLNDQRQQEDPDDRARKFFSQLPRSIIIQLYHAYKIDFDMFGYEEPKKFIEMGYILPDEENEIGPPKHDPRRGSNLRQSFKKK